jgi:hypothetical protein
MKKLLLFVFLFTFSIGFSQINTQVTPLTVCDDNNDGFAVFDLAVKNTEILMNLNPAIHTVSYHETLSDAVLGFNSISFNYTNINPSSQTIFVRVVNTQSSAVLTTQFSLNVNPIAVGNPATLTFCNPGMLPIYNLNDATGQILNGQTSVIVTYYQTLADALNGTNQITTTSAFAQNQPNTQTLFARVTNTITSCFTITTVTLTSCNTQCLPPTNLTITNASSTSVVLNWNNTTGNLWEVLILPFGSPSPTPNASAGIFAQSNPYVFTGLTPGICYSAYVRTACNPGTTSVSNWSTPVSFCIYDCTNNAACPESLELIAFYDTNNNGIKDASETNFNNGNFVYTINSGTPLYGNTNNGSFYVFENNPANSYNLSFAVNSNLTTYYNSATTFNNITVPTGSGSHAYYFPITQLQPYNDLEVLLIPNGVPRPGFIHQNTLYYRNKGYQTTTSGTVNFTKSANVSIVNNSQSGVVSNPTGFSYAFTNLLPNEQRSIVIGLQVPTIPTVNLGDMVTNSATITPLTGDAIPADNAATLSQVVVGSYDPNDKTESHGRKIVYSSFSSNDYLTYTIQFENTGTANAEFIRIEDLLDASLDKNSIVMLNSSHSYDMRRINNKLIWNFYAINLPSTATNPTQSHGFIQFKIKPTPGYAVGTTIPNSAEIYFDYNPPIYTNTFITEFVQTLKTESFTNSDFILYPNPASDFVQINLKNDSEKIKTIVIYDVVGKVVKTINDINLSEAKISTSQLNKGLYLIEITSDTNLKQVKKLIIK